MGNYSGTTRCGYCGERGHNKAGCPKLKARVEELRKTDPNSYVVQRWDAKAEKRTKRATGKRVCAYCAAKRKTIDAWEWRTMDDDERAATGMVNSTKKDRWGHTENIGVERDSLYDTDGERGVGHSIRACKYRKRDIAERTSQVKVARVNHMKRMIDNGIGPGATVVFREGCQAHDHSPTPGSFVIQSVNWAALGIEDHKWDNPDVTYFTMPVARAVHIAHIFNPSPPYNYFHDVTLPANTLEDVTPDTYVSRYTASVVSLHRPASAEKVRNSIPFGWADATDEATQAQILEALMTDVKTRSKKK
jgi:hypothetical protein